MKIDIQARNYVVRDRLKELIEKKVSKLEKYFDKDVSAKVLCSANKEKDRFKLEITLTTVGKIVRAEVESDNMYTNLDLCLARIEKQTVKFNQKKIDQKRKPVDVTPLEFDFFDEIPVYVKPKIVKHKTYDLVPMTAEEAIDRMELLGNTFFIFLNDKSNTVNVVYKRIDGDYGLIETH